MRLEERARVRARAREAEVMGDRQVLRSDEPGARASRVADPPPARQRWHDDTDSAGEPTELRDYERRPARFYAPPGQCVYCDRRRESARRSMAAVRERGTDA